MNDDFNKINENNSSTHSPDNDTQTYESIDPIYSNHNEETNTNHVSNISSTPNDINNYTGETTGKYRTYKPIKSSTIVTPETVNLDESLIGTTETSVDEIETSNIYSNYSEIDNNVNQNNFASYDRGDYSANFNSNNYQTQTKPTTANTPRRKPIRKFFRFVAIFVVFVFLGGVVFGAGYGSAIYLGDRLTPDLVERTKTLSFDVNRIEPVISTSSTIESSTNIVTSIAKTAGPSVVTVTSSFKVNNNNLFNNRSAEVEGTGSGIIYELRDNDLLIITNHHVIEDANSVEITFHDGHTLEVDIVGYDSTMDLAVLSIPLTDLDNSDVTDITVATFGDSKNLEVGELAVAIGNPLGKQFSSTVTAGVISAVNRQLNIDGSNLSLLQTDAAINPGNSGGALVNANGEVIGVNTAKYVDESVEGMGFSIPIHIALPIISNIIDSSSGTDIAPVVESQPINADRPFLGVGIDNITDEIYNETNMPFGIYVTQVFEDSAADKAGIEIGDVIYSIDGVKLNDTDDLFAILADKKVGDTLKISVARDEDVLHLEATLTKASDILNN